MRLDSHSIEIKNNLAFSLLAQSKLEEANQVLNQIIHIETSTELTGHTLANLGMFAYRMGEIDTGRKTYERACEAFSKLKQSSPFALCCAYWAKEARMAGDPNASQIFDQTKDIVDRSKSSAARCVLNFASSLTDKIEPTKEGLLNSAVKVTHDAARNVLILERSNAFPITRK